MKTISGVQMARVLLHGHFMGGGLVIFARLEHILLIQGLPLLQIALLVQLEHIFQQQGPLAVVHVYLECFLQ